MARAGGAIKTFRKFYDLFLSYTITGIDITANFHKHTLTSFLTSSIKLPGLVPFVNEIIDVIKRLYGKFGQIFHIRSQ